MLGGIIVIAIIFAIPFVWDWLRAYVRKRAYPNQDKDGE